MQRNCFVTVITICLVVLFTSSCISSIQTSTAQSSTPTATIVKTNTPATLLGVIIRAEKGGFAYRPLIGYKVHDSSDNAMISSDKENIIIALTIGPSKSWTTIDLLNLALNSFGLTQITEPEKYALNGVDGIKVEVKTDAFFGGATGEVIVLTPDEKRYFTAVGIAGSNGIDWHPGGKILFDAVLNSVTFFEPSK